MNDLAVARHLGVEHLDRSDATDQRVLGAEHGAHRSARPSSSPTARRRLTGECLGDVGPNPTDPDSGKPSYYACSASGSPAPAWPLALAFAFAFLVRRRRRRRRR